MLKHLPGVRLPRVWMLASHCEVHSEYKITNSFFVNTEVNKAFTGVNKAFTAHMRWIDAGG